MVKRVKTSGNDGNAIVLERQYGPYTVKVCFAERDSSTAQNLLDMIMQAYRYRMERAQSFQTGR